MNITEKHQLFNAAKAYLEGLAYRVTEEKVGYTITYPNHGGSDRCADFEIIRLAKEMGMED